MLRRLHPRTLALLLLIAASAAAVRSQTVRPNPTPAPSPARAKAAIAGNPALVQARPETAINKAASTQPAPATPTPTPSAASAKAAVNPAILQGRPGEVVAETVVPELYWHTQRDAEVMLAQAHLQLKLSAEPEGSIVVNQEPLPGNKVVTGSTVTITLGQPQLLLSADQLRAAINTNINFTATLEPPLPQTTAPVETAAYIPPRLQATYTFYWDDSPQISSSQISPTSQTEQIHRYAAPKTYNVYATAQIGSYQIKSNLVSITIPEPNPVTPSYAVNVRVEPRTVNVGDKVKATVETTPPPPPETSYKIDWGDGVQEVHNSPIATHAYSPPARKRAVHATVTVANRDFHSNAIAVEIRTPPEPVQPEKPPPFNPWPWIIGVVVGIGVSVGLYKLIRRGPKLPLYLPQGLSITSSRGQIQNEIHHAEQIGKTAGIRFISGCTSSVTMTPQSGIVRKRSTTHA